MGRQRIKMRAAVILPMVAAMVAVVQSREVTKMLETLEGYDHFSNIQVFIDQPSCSDGNPDDVCNLEGYEYPCCHVTKGTDIKGHITMISEEDTLDNGLITCRVGVGEDYKETCLEPEFCNSLN